MIAAMIQKTPIHRLRRRPASAWAASGFFAVPGLFAVLGAAGCGEESGFAAEETGAEAADTRTVVAVAPVVAGSLTDVLEISGRLEPRAEVLVSAELGGAVEEVLFDKGNRVERGQLLARVGSDLLRAALDEAEADLEAARIEHERARRLVEREASPEQELTGAEATLKRAEARAESARLRFTRSEIAAPAAGVIAERAIEPGEVLGPGSPVAMLQDLSSLRATIGIPETDIAFFRVGSPAQVAVDAYPDRALEGRIAYIAPNATRPGRNFQAEIEVANPDGTLRAGLIVRARLERRRYEEAVVISRDLLVERDGILHAFVLEGGGEAAMRAVSLGPDEGDLVVVTAGLEVGETLIVGGHRSLLDGQPVRVAPGAGR